MTMERLGLSPRGDRKDHLIEILMQQRDAANNQVANLMAEANERIADLEAQIEALKKEKRK